MLVIEPLPVDAAIKTRVMDLDHYDLLFFISTNAAQLGLSLIADYWPQFPVGLAIYAVGPTTAAVIEEAGLHAEYPAERMSSEALLALDSLQDIAGKKALVVRGVGGRELLAEALKSRQASVDYLELYRRNPPALARGELANWLAREKPAAVIVTSAEALDNFVSQLSVDRQVLSGIPLFVSSQRIADSAATAGFTRIVVMPGADDKAIIDSLQDHL